ncbi:MAG: succinate dehydrogenase cytochrome b subunit [Deltaproteobacteria bacterium]|nr:succinate dehydrogenase cytochrome b subunit [Deltaproteobacteria bacterium]
MQWIVNFFGSSVGKKLMMALTGFCFVGFLTGHLVGNLTLYGGRDAFNAYADHLHALGPLINLVELVLLTMAVVHVLTGLLLYLQNLKARPVRYVVNKNAGGRTISSSLMPYTGFIILMFLIFHLLQFHFVDKTYTTIYDIVSMAFASVLNVSAYIAAMVVVALHIKHGFWSLFQTLGANHPKYMPIIMGASLVFSLIFGIGFGFLPVYVSFSG